MLRRLHMAGPIGRAAMVGIIVMNVDTMTGAIAGTATGTTTGTTTGAMTGAMTGDAAATDNRRRAAPGPGRPGAAIRLYVFPCMAHTAK